MLIDFECKNNYWIEGRSKRTLHVMNRSFDESGHRPSSRYCFGQEMTQEQRVEC